MPPQVIVVTGASRGIGLAVAKHLLEAKHQVVLVSRSETELEALQSQYPSQVKYLAADLTDFDVALKLTELAVSSFGRLDGIVINHGVLKPMTRIADSSVEDWKRLYDVNLFSALALAKAAIPHLRESKGRIVLVSSGAAGHAYQSWGAYGSSKAAANSLVQHLAVEEPEISSVALSPGRCDTGMQAEVRDMGKGVMRDEEHTDFVKAFEDGRLNKPELPAYVIAQLALAATPDLSGKYFSWSAAELVSFRETW